VLDKALYGKLRSCFELELRLSGYAMSFQILELALDAGDNIIERRVFPCPFLSRREAFASATSIATRYPEAGYDPANDYWCARDGSGERIRVTVEEVPTELENVRIIDVSGRQSGDDTGPKSRRPLR